jgi:hypothetical protein
MLSGSYKFKYATQEDIILTAATWLPFVGDKVNDFLDERKRAHVEELIKSAAEEICKLSPSIIEFENYV